MQAQTFLTMIIGTTPVQLALDNNVATAALLQHLQQGDATIAASRYGGFEQVGRLPWSLPTTHRQMTTQAGDVVLYNDNQLVIFFGSNSWSYTRLGRIVGLNAAQLRTLLNVERCDIRLSLVPSAIKEMKTETTAVPLAYLLSEQRAGADHRGIVVEGGRKFIKR